MQGVKGEVYLIGAGFVADLYMRSFKTFPQITVAGVHDVDAGRLDVFADYWNAPKKTLGEILGAAKSDGPKLVLNLTNPHAHFEVSKAALEAGHHVYSEKPLATDMEDARQLHALARERGLLLGSAPCNWLSDSARTVWQALNEDEIGAPRLVYAELDDDFITQAPYDQWKSESGAPWPAEDEFKVGCTLEHAGYYLTWLLAIFGPVERVVAASADILPDKLPDGGETAADFSTATLFFKSGMIARLTCSIIAPHDHHLRIFGDKGVLELKDCWNNTDPVKVRRRFTVRRKLITSPLAKKIALKGEKQPRIGRFGAASMNFALGPAHMLKAIAENQTPLLSADFSLHVNEVTLAIQNAGKTAGSQIMTTSFEPFDLPETAI